MLTYKFRVKDSNKINVLKKMASDTNYLWNFVNAHIRRRWKESRVHTSAFDANRFVVGASSVLSIASPYVSSYS